MPPGPIIPPHILDLSLHIIIIVIAIIVVFGVLKLFNKVPENTKIYKNNTSLENAIEEMVREIKALRRDIEELKEELKE